MVTTAVLMVVLLGLMALAIDVGTMTQVRTQLQRSADAAALAGASKLHDQNAATAVVAEATRYVSMNSVAGTSIALDPVDVEIGIWNPGDRSFTPRSSSLGNAVRVTPRTREGTLFFGRIFTSEPPEIRASAIAATRPREIAFVIDLSGSMNDDTEPCWATDEIALRWGAGPANRLMENLYSDLGLGTFPGAVQWVGQGTGVLTDEWAYAELTDNQGPLTRIVDRYYRILSTDTEAERKTKAYRWIIDSQIAAVMPKAGPVADSRQNFEFWSKYLDYVIGPVWVADSGDPNNGGGGVTPPTEPGPSPEPSPGQGKLDLPRELHRGLDLELPQSPATARVAAWLDNATRRHNVSFTSLFASAMELETQWLQSTSAYPPGTPPFGRGMLPFNQDKRRIYGISSNGDYAFNNPNLSVYPDAVKSRSSFFRNHIGYRTYVQFLLDYGRDLTIGGTASPLAVGGGAPLHRETTTYGAYDFPPREQPLHAARRALVMAIEEIRERNRVVAGQVDSRYRDWVSLITFDRDATLRVPLGGTDADYARTIQESVNLQATNDEGPSTSLDNALEIVAQHLATSTNGGAGRDGTDRVVVLLTDGVPNKQTISKTQVSNYIRDTAPAEYRGDFYYDYGPRDAALMSVLRMRLNGWKVYIVGVGAGARADFLERMARLGGTTAPYVAGSDPQLYEQQLVDLFRKIVTQSRVKLVD
ncbi:MAG TPA: VWA domain-containing protein [Pirellulaceae bacterium]|nr:VWA domain-containing protein [Pirellulaceae bacterium]